MERNDNIYIIDPEFTFLGSKEFDLGIMSGHLILATGQISYLKKICDNYPDKIDNNEVAIYCAIEIIRRLIGYAQLPIKRSIREKSDLLKLANELIILSNENFPLVESQSILLLLAFGKISFVISSIC